MNNNAEKLLEFLNQSNFNVNIFTEEENDIIAKIIRSSGLFKDFSLDHGASKCVIIPKEEDYVIKIPYTGQYLEAEEDYLLEYYYNEFYDGADGWNYCQTELNNYNLAKEEGFENYLAPIHLLGYIKGHFPIYIQAKCVVSWRKDCSYTYEEEKNTSDIINSSGRPSCYTGDLPINWLTAFRYEYGENELINFLTFLEDNEWGDLRDDNVGFLNDKPVLIDYSDFFG